MRLAAQYDDEEANARAARFAIALARTFQEACRIALNPGRLQQRAAAMSALECCASALALRLWGLLLATRAHEGGDIERSPSSRRRGRPLRAPSDLVLEQRRGDGPREPNDRPWPLELGREFVAGL